MGNIDTFKPYCTTIDGKKKYLKFRVHLCDRFPDSITFLVVNWDGKKSLATCHKDIKYKIDKRWKWK